MRKLKNYDDVDITQRKKYEVYEDTKCGPVNIGETTAKSEAEAINHVRYRLYGNTRCNDEFFAREAIDGIVDFPEYKWYVVEFSVMDGYDPYFYQPYAAYEVVCARSDDKARHMITKEYFDYGNGSERSFSDAYFGRTKEFSNKADAERCAKEWSKQNDEDNKNGIRKGPMTNLDVLSILINQSKEEC